ncbi:MAG: type VII toxin-antitoxin system MntA family adenylyltransferase antitoxin [Candidatus Ratteibacteria bacterium]
MKRIKKDIKEIFKNLGVLLVYIFGSYVYGIENKKSDIDIAILLNGKPDMKKYLLFYKIFSEIFKNKEVDIVFLNQAPLTLRFEVVNDGILIYQDRKYLSYEYKEKILKEYIDFKHHLDQFNKTIIESL